MTAFTRAPTISVRVSHIRDISIRTYQRHSIEHKLVRPNIPKVQPYNFNKSKRIFTEEEVALLSKGPDYIVKRRICETQIRCDTELLIHAAPNVTYEAAEYDMNARRINCKHSNFRGLNLLSSI
ncbi:hypothetical protein ACOME3_006683 [Neoechinorhynchus agilis]